MSEDEILIGEGVVLDARPASFATRSLAAGIDLLVLGAGAIVLTLFVLSAGSATDEAALSALALLLVVTITVGVPTMVETLSRGRSLGKLALGLRVVRDDGGPVRFRHALIRALVGVFELWMTAGGVALLVSLLNSRGKRLGDLVAGTYVIRARGGARALPPLVGPPELAAWARRADIRRLPDGLALSARQFLARAERLHLGSRVSLGMDLAAEIERYVAPGPPPGTHPERFLAAVLVERRNRELVHASRVAERSAQEAQLAARLPYGVPDPH
jgi:uncharacterized RDD family membrane protein YckC